MNTVPFHERLLCPVEDAMAAIGVGRTKIYELFNNGTIETRKVGTKRLVVVSSLKQLSEPSAAKAEAVAA